jgi:hypothetical protein
VPNSGKPEFGWEREQTELAAGSVIRTAFRLDNIDIDDDSRFLTLP